MPGPLTILQNARQYPTLFIIKAPSGDDQRVRFLFQVSGYPVSHAGFP